MQENKLRYTFSLLQSFTIHYSLIIQLLDTIYCAKRSVIKQKQNKKEKRGDMPQENNDEKFISVS